ncbi:MAG: hypothetical protein WBI47_10600 [Atribacterales bacterium]
MASLRIFNIQKLLSLYTGEKIWEQTKENYKRKKYFPRRYLVEWVVNFSVLPMVR